LTGVDHNKIVDWLGKLEELYQNQGEEQQQEQSLYSVPESPPLVEGIKPPNIVEDPAVQGTIALLKHKFAQLEKLKESSHGQRIPLYNSRSSGQRTQACPSNAARMGNSAESSPDSSYDFDETTATLLAVQQEMMWNSARSSTSVASESNRSQSHNWPAMGDSSSRNMAFRGDETNHVVPSFPKVRSHNPRRQSNLGVFHDSNAHGIATTNMGFGGTTTEVSLECLFAAERTESAGAPKMTNIHRKPSASSIENAMSRLSQFSLNPKILSPKCKTPKNWGAGSSFNAPVASDRSGKKVRGSEVCETGSNASDVRSLYGRVECREDIRIEHSEVVDTSLRL
jgi:hypothetical protein